MQNLKLNEACSLNLVNRHCQVLVEEICSDGHFKGVKWIF